MPLVSIIVPCYNEGPYIGEFGREILGGLQAARLHGEVVFVENGSTDNTFEELQYLEKCFPHHVRIERTTRADYGFAVKSGILSARGDKIVKLDLDGWDPEFVREGVKALENFDGVLGSKLHPLALDRRHWPRRLLTRIHSCFARLLFGFPFSDPHGIFAIRSSSKGHVKLCSSDADLFSMELLLRMSHAGMKIMELPMNIQEQRPSRSSVLMRGLKVVQGGPFLYWSLLHEGILS